MIPPEIAERFHGDPGVDIATYEIDARFLDGEVRRVVLKIGAPYPRKETEDWRIRAELEHLEQTEGPLSGENSLQALVIGIAWMVTRLRVLQRRHQITYTYAGSQDEFEYEKVLSTTGLGHVSGY